MKYSTPVTNPGRDSFQGHFETGMGMKAGRAPHTQPHGPAPSHMADGDHTYKDAVRAVHAQTKGRISAPGLKPGTQATLQTGAPMPTPKSRAQASKRMVSQGEAIKRTVSIKGKNPMKMP